jgi:hypothetical protein
MSKCPRHAPEARCLFAKNRCLLLRRRPRALDAGCGCHMGRSDCVQASAMGLLRLHRFRLLTTSESGLDCLRCLPRCVADQSTY